MDSFQLADLLICCGGFIGDHIAVRPENLVFFFKNVSSFQKFNMLGLFQKGFHKGVKADLAAGQGGVSHWKRQIFLRESRPSTHKHLLHAMV